MLAFSTLIVLAAIASPAVLAGSPETCSSPQLSCTSTSAAANTCCFNAPGGQLLQTQFWDTSPSTGPSNSWTIHGLWPDHCDGTYDSNCDASRAYTNITAILQSFGKTDLLDYMNTYWISDDGTDESFWEHEWAKHGTCISTLEASCYTDYTPQEEVPDFFQKVVDLFQTLDTYTALANAGIVPSNTATYTEAAIEAALKDSFGYDVTIQCSSGALDEVWYSFEVQGSVQTGTFVPIAPMGQSSTCPSTGIQYLPKSGSPVSSSTTTTTTKSSLSTTSSSQKTTTSSSVTTKSSSLTTSASASSSIISSTPTTTTSSSASATSTSGRGTFSGKGYLNAYTRGSQTGCLISYGAWYASGTCATYTATASGSGFTLSSSKGSCGISGSTFTCGSGVTATVFTASGGALSYGGSTTFYAVAIPTGSTQESIYTTTNSISASFEWESM